MAKLVNTRWSTRAAVALVITIALAGCGKRDDRNGDPDDPTPNPPLNNPTDTFAITSMNRLVSFNRNSPAIRNPVAITGLAATETIVGFDFRPADGTIILLTRSGSSAQLYRLNSSDGTTSLIGPLMADSLDNSAPFMGLDGISFGVNFNPVPDRLRVVSNTGQNLRIDVNGGATITDAGLLNADGVSSAAGITATAYTNSFPSACRTNLFYIDTTGKQLLTTADPNQGMLTPVGAIAVDTNATITGFEVLTTADSSNNDSPVNTALIVSTANGASTLMTLNLNTAAVTNAQSITGLDTGETITAISMAPPNRTPQQPLGELVAVTQFNRLISFNRGAPQKLCTGPTNITGLQAGDNVLGIDVRPRDGLLYALGSSSTRLYTISTTPGNTFASATMGPMLQPGGSFPFNGLSGNDFGFDFNPMTDRLRVVSNTGQNLSIDVDMGLATSQSTLNPGLPGVTAAAYSGNVVNSSATTLYVIDTSNEGLATQGVPTTTPANGTLTRIGNLGTADITGSNGFDISGRDGAAVAAFTLASNTSSSDLFTINLGSGLATRVNTIGGGERIRGLAFSNAPLPMLIAVTADNQLLTFDPAKPDTLVDSVSIDGLQGGETVIGLQVRADGKLQITSDGQRSYTLDAVSGAATLIASTEIAKPRATSGTTNTGVRFNASVSNDTGLSFAANVSALGQSRLFKLDVSGQATAVGMIGPSGTAPVRALAIRLD